MSVLVGTCGALVLPSTGAMAQAHPAAEQATGQPVTPLVATPPLVVTVFVSSDRDGTFFGRAAAFGPVPRRLRWPDLAWDGVTFAPGVCAVPCSTQIAVSEGPYRVVGPDMAPSQPFDLAAISNGLDVHVHAGSWPGYVIGRVSEILGTVFAVTGAVELVAWEAVGHPRVVNHTAGVLLPSGISFAALGGVLLAIGIPLFSASQTRVDLSEHHDNAFPAAVQPTSNGM